MQKNENLKEAKKVKVSSNPLLSAVISDCTYLLVCRHCIGRNCRDYYMPCILLGKTKNGKRKLIVFGERDWKGKEHIKRIKYVNNSRLIIHSMNHSTGPRL